jgi:hypothetical protein
MAVQCWSGTWPELVFLVGAGEGNRTLMTSLEVRWHGSARELRDRLSRSHGCGYPSVTVTDL